MSNDHVRLEGTCPVVRSKCLFLSDDNHDWIARDYGPCKPEHKALKDLTQSSRYSIKDLTQSSRYSIKDLTQSSRYSIVINRKPGQEWYGYRYWFHFAYRVPGQPY